MLNIGIVGITEILEPFVKRIQKNKNVNVIGKASVGTSPQLYGFHFSIPEFNRIELVERADVLLVDNSSLLPFEMLCDMVKKSKHVFATTYLNISVEQCAVLEKLADESGSVVQISNPGFYTPAIQWLGENAPKPIFIEVAKFGKDVQLRDTLFSLLFMLSEFIGTKIKRFAVNTFESEVNNAAFTNVRLDFGNASVVNLNFGIKGAVNKFQIEAFSNDEFITLDFSNKNFTSNEKAIDFSEFQSINEFDSFIGSIQSLNRESSNLEQYKTTLDLVENIEKKIKQFIG